MVKFSLITFILTFHFLKLAAQIPNGGFELWDKEFNYSKPTSWWTNQDTIHPRIEKDTVSVEGNYALKMVPSVTSSWEGCESRAGMRVKFDSILPEHSVLTFYVKSVPQDIIEDSSVYLLLFGLTFNSDSVLGGFDWRTETPIFDFEKIEIPLPGENIDEISFFIYGGASTDPSDGPCLGRSISWIDDMTIDFGTSAGLSPIQEKNEFMIYPNPTAYSLTLDIPTGDAQRIYGYEIINEQGQIVDIARTMNGKEINVSNLVAGVYSLVLKEDGVNVGVRKFVKL